MFEFLTNKSAPAKPVAPSVATTKAPQTLKNASKNAPMNAKSAPEPHPLDTLTGGAFSASTAGDRAAKVRDWMATNPSTEQMQEVFKELSARDKGAVKPIREKLDELKKAKGQEAVGEEWAAKAQALLSLGKLNIADAMAWQRDAAKAGAPLSKEPLASVKLKLAERVKSIEDLQHHTQVQREAAVLLAQRTEILSTKSYKDAINVLPALQTDVQHWQDQAQALVVDANWSSVDVKFAPLLDASKAQLLVVWDAFQAALKMTETAALDASAPLPPVPVWADELRALRGVAKAEEAPKKPAKPKIDPEVKLQAANYVRTSLLKLEQEVAEGHGKASAGAANALRNALKEHGKLIDDKLENQAHAALAAAGELEGWQRWRADQIREELLIKAEGLLKRPDGQALGGRKMQETLRAMRDQWKQTDQGGPANHTLWKRFDDACNAAHEVVEAWIEKVKAENAIHRAERLNLMAEVTAWGQGKDGAGGTSSPVAELAGKGDWKAISRGLNQFADRWQNLGHVSEKTFAELQPQWKAAMDAAYAPLQAAQKSSVDRRHAMIEEAKALTAMPVMPLRWMDAVKALQQQWTHEAQSIPLDRKFEQKLWDAFRHPIDEAFNRKTQDREKAASAMGEHDKLVLEASKALQAANASADGQKIRAAIAALEAAIKGQTAAKVVENTAIAAEKESNMALAGVSIASTAIEKVANENIETTSDTTVVLNTTEGASPLEQVEAQEVADVEADAIADAAEEAEKAAAEPVEPVEPAKPIVVPKKVIAVRGDDRPGMKKSEPAPAGRGGKFGDRKPGDRDNRGDSRGPRSDSRSNDRFSDRGDRPSFEDRGPRLGDAAFRAQREALDAAQYALKKLAAAAHGEVLVQLLDAWQTRDAAKMPSAQDLGKHLPPTARSAWAAAITATPAAAQADADTALLRLEMAAELPTPAEHLAARRMLQLQLLTKRNDPAPAQTWTQDATKVLANNFEEGAARRLMMALKHFITK
jgi:ATP-dependent RNA helicase SUPV3L1/SUV3